MRASSFLMLATLLCARVAAHADTTALINFDDRPQGPSYYDEAGPTQTLVYPQATFSGGVILGLASAFPANIYASNPNQYATSTFGDPSLLPTLTIALAPTFHTSEVSFALFNGLDSTESYTVQAYDGTNLLETLNYSIAANTDSGYVLPDLMGSNITSVLISANDTSAYDFLIDDVALNQSVQQAVSPTPEPSSFALLGTGLLGAAQMIRRRRLMA